MKSLNMEPNFRGNVPMSIMIKDSANVVKIPRIEMKLNYKLEHSKMAMHNHAELMNSEEAKEKHLLSSLSGASEIPVPDNNIIEIDENIYNKMYPEMTKNYLRPKSRIRSFPDDLEDNVDYDADTSDINWIEKQPKEWQPTLPKFEKAIAFLEVNSIVKVQTLEEFQAQVPIKLRRHESEAIYDYWLNKRLSTKQKLMYRLKKQQKNKSFRLQHLDPYIVFREIPDKVHTRKNRARDKENYMIMLKYRRELHADVENYKQKSLHEQNRHQALKDKFKLFRREYKELTSYRDFSREKDFSDNFPLLPSKMIEVEKPRKEVSDTESADEDNNHSFSFTPQSDCQYLIPVNDGVSWSYPDCYEKPKTVSPVNVVEHSRKRSKRPRTANKHLNLGNETAGKDCKISNQDSSRPQFTLRNSSSFNIPLKAENFEVVMFWNKCHQL